MKWKLEGNSQNHWDHHLLSLNEIQTITWQTDEACSGLPKMTATSYTLEAEEMIQGSVPVYVTFKKYSTDCGARPILIGKHQ